MSDSEWKFVDPPNQASISTRQVFEEGYPILRVSHDEDDGGWQFLCGTTDIVEDGRVVGIGDVIELDPSISEVSDLPLGWIAYRETADSPWVRMKR